MQTEPKETQSSGSSEEVTTVVIRFCGDSGDGMQLTGTEFTKATALAGNDLSTLPDFPAEIRAPAGSLAGVSGFQLNFSSAEVFTPGDQPDVLVAMNPAALKTNLPDLVTGGILVANKGAFSRNNLNKAGYSSNPLEDGSLEKYRLYSIDISRMTADTLKESGLSTKEIGRCKNFFALGLMFWLYTRPVDPEIESIKKKFKKIPHIADANIKVFKAGYYFGETTELFPSSYVVPAADIKPGRYRNITGNEATALGFVAASQLSGVPLVLGTYPITPASDILHHLSNYRHYGVTTVQAEDEIAGVGIAIGASFGGAMGITSTSGPGVALKSEAIGLAVVAELPLIIIDVQRGGPSTGLPTKTEQADLLQALYGRNSDCPLAIIAPSTPADCFTMAIEALRIAATYMVPVFFLSDGYLANGAEPWLIPDLNSFEKIPVKFRTETEGYYPYLRDKDTLARPWAKPGTPGLEHRVGGLEKDFLTGNVSYDPINHERMVRIRGLKVKRIADSLPPTQIVGDQEGGDVLLLGWGGTYGALTKATQVAREQGKKVSHVHLKYLNPLPNDLHDILKRFKHVLVPELNMGQLVKVIRAEYLIDAKGFNKIQGKPFKVSEILRKIEEMLGERPQTPPMDPLNPKTFTDNGSA